MKRHLKETTKKETLGYLGWISESMDFIIFKVKKIGSDLYTDLMLVRDSVNQLLADLRKDRIALYAAQAKANGLINKWATLEIAI